MVCEYLNGVKGAFQLRSPFLKSTHNCHQFLVVDLVVGFCRAVLLGVEGDWVENCEAGGYYLKTGDNNRRAR
jgi:hypothetical protein